MIILLGNSSAIESPPGTSVTSPDGEASTAGEPKELPGDRITTFHIASPFDEALAEVKASWRLHSTGKPTWVEGDDEFFVEAISRTFGCPIGRENAKEQKVEDESDES